MTCGIYKIENKINGKVYIGQSINIERRWREHNCNYINSSTVLYKAIRKHGIANFTFEIIHTCSENELNELEIYYIEKYNSFAYNSGSNGYNMTFGGDNNTRGRIVSKSQKVKTSLTAKERLKNRKNHPLSKVTVCDNIEFDSIKDCAEYLNIKYETMRGYVSGKESMPISLYERGLKLKYENIIYQKIPETRDYIKKGKEVVCEEIIFSSIKDCAKYYGVYHGEMCQWLKNKKMPKKFIEKRLWYNNEEFPIDEIKNNVENSIAKRNNASKNRVKKILCSDMVFENIHECSKYFNISLSTLRSWLNHSNNMPIYYYNMNLRYADESFENYICQETTEDKSKRFSKQAKNKYVGGRNPNSIKVFFNGIIFSCIKDLSNELNISYGKLLNWLSQKVETPQKYIDLGLRYATEEDLKLYPIHSNENIA